jgi:hypothetical protein
LSLNPDKFSLLQGGLRAGVLHMNGHDLVHHGVLGDVLYGIIEHEARAHGAEFHGGQFDKIIEAVKTNKVSSYFFLAGWETCRAKIIGGSIEFPSVLTEWDGKQFQHYPAIYGEDTCILPGGLKALVRERPAGRSFPEHIGLGAWFEQERINRWTVNSYGDAPLGMAARGRIGEYSAHSSAMIKILDQFGATRGTEQKDTVLEVNGLTPVMKEKWRLPVEITGLAGNGKHGPSSNIFLARWVGEGGRQQIAASFTNGLSSFTGDPVARVQITGNGHLPNNGTLQCVLASLLAAGEEEIQMRRWGQPRERSVRCPLIPLLGSRTEIYTALLEASHDEVTERRIGASDVGRIFGGRPPIMRIHALGEPQIIAALMDMGTQIRSLGPHPMLPVVMDFNNIPAALNPEPVPARPVKTINPKTTASDPVMSLVA